MKRNLLINGIIAILIVGALVASYLLIESKPAARKSATVTRKLSVKTHTELSSDFDIEIKIPAKVVSQDMVALGVEVSGKIERGAVALKAGQMFRKGDLLFSINIDDTNAKLMSAKSKFLTLLSSVLPDIRVDFESQYPKWESFFANLTLDGKLPPFPAFENNREKVYLASKGVVSAYYDIVSLELTAKKHNIYAPFNGVFTTITKEVGAIISANNQIGTISATDNLDIVASVSQSDAARITVGDKATIIARDGREFSGKITRVSSFVDAKTQMIDVYINLHEPSRAIVEGEMVSTIIPVGMIRNVVKLPTDAVANGGVIYGVDKDNKLYSMRAKIEYEYGEWSYVSEVPTGSRIVQESLITPIEGLEVNVIEQHID